MPLVYSLLKIGTEEESEKVKLNKIAEKALSLPVLHYHGQNDPLFSFDRL